MLNNPKSVGASIVSFNGSSEGRAAKTGAELLKLWCDSKAEKGAYFALKIYSEHRDYYIGLARKLKKQPYKKVKHPW